MTPRIAIFCGGLLGATGVAAGAIGAHFLATRLAAAQLEQFDVAVRYELVSALALLILGAFCGREPARGWLSVAAWLLLCGTLLFSGCLYGYIAAVKLEWPLKWLVHFVPMGGTMMIAGWLALCPYALSRER